MHSARARSCSTSSVGTNPGASTTPASPRSAIAASTAPRSGPSPRMRPRSPGMRSRAQPDRGHDRGRALLRDVAAGEEDERLGGQGRGPRRRAGVEPAQHGHLAAHAAAPQPVRGQLREGEGPLAHAQAAPLHRLAHAAAGLPEVRAPVGAAPQLEPVHHEPEAADGARRRRGEQREVRERRGVHDVVAVPRGEEVGEDARAEDERRGDPALPGAAVERHPRAHADHADARHLAPLPARPLAQRDVGHLVPVGREPLREVAVPALRAPDGVGEQAVVDEADPQAGRLP